MRKERDPIALNVLQLSWGMRISIYMYRTCNSHAYKALNLQQSLTYHTLKLTGIKL